MKKNFKIRLLASAILVSSIAVFVACDTSSGGNEAKGKMTTRDVYAMSAVSGVSYLSENETGAVQTASGLLSDSWAMVTAAAARPSYIADSDVTGIRRCIVAFENILGGSGVEQTVKENSATDPRFSGYTLEMNISMPVGSGAFEAYTIYFNEIETRVESEMDDFEEEIEETTTFEGVVVYGEELFVVKGVKEVEREGRETETSLEFRTYKNVGVDEVQADQNNFVVVSQSVEEGELEYEYSFYENGRKIQEIELEYEESIWGVELSFQIKDGNSGRLQETEYELRKKDGKFIVEFEKDRKRDKITVSKVEDGYKFVYSNDFEEIVG